MKSRTCRLSLAWATGIALVLGIAGCGSSSAMRTSSSSYKRNINANLVLPGDEMSYSQSKDWQHGRNDQRLSVGREMPSTYIDEVEIRSNDRININDGRPHNHSTTRIRSIRRHKSP